MADALDKMIVDVATISTIVLEGVDKILVARGQSPLGRAEEEAIAVYVGNQIKAALLKVVVQ